MLHDILPFVGKTFLVTALLSVAMFLCAAPVAPEIVHLAAIKNKTKVGLSGMPSYTCSETIDLSAKRSKRDDFRKTDELKFEVAEIGGKELFSRPGQKAFGEMPKELAYSGLVVTGMFSHIAETVFGSPVARFQYVGEKKLKGHKSLQYALTVAPLFASYQLTFNGHQAQCGFRGSFWADASSMDLIRLEIEATDVPAELLLRSATTQIDYTKASLNGRSYLIPSNAEIVTTFVDGKQSRSQIRFSNCRKYEVESNVTFQ